MTTITTGLEALVTREALLGIAGETYFARGVVYARAGRVGALAVDGDRLVARVEGTEEYRVCLRVVNGELDGNCSCPLGMEGAFCKHCVAVGLAWLAARGEEGDGEGGEADAPRERRAGPAPRVTRADELRAWLERQEAAVLVELVVNEAMDDPRLMRDLLLRAERDRPGGPDPERIRAAIDQALRLSDYEDDGDLYRVGVSVASALGRVVDEMEAMLERGHATGVMELAEHAIARGMRVADSVDDSSGMMGGELERLVSLHLRACRQARPDPAALGRRLFALEMRSSYLLSEALDEYFDDVPGAEVLAGYREAAEAEWASVPALGPGEKDPEYYGRRSRLASIMEGLAGMKGTEALVEVLSRDLSSSHRFLTIAQAYRAAGDGDRALEWARRGMAAFPREPVSRLRDFVVEELHCRGSHDEALELVWDGFTDAPGLRSYQTLKEHAERGGGWPRWRERALAHLREALAPAKRKGAALPDWPRLNASTELARILLWEGDVEGAWRQALADGCREDLRWELARRREKEHPEDAIPLYRLHVESAIQAMSNSSYAEAAGLLVRLRELMIQVDEEIQFASYLAALRKQHRPKRNFMKALDQAGL